MKSNEEKLRRKPLRIIIVDHLYNDLISLLLGENLNKSFWKLTLLPLTDFIK
jgi:hypothetical protein